MVNNWLERGLQWVYPPTCVLCRDRGAEGRDLCDPCFRDLPRNSAPCRVCAEPLSTPGALCGHCIQSPPPFDRVVAPFLYTFPFQQLIAALKFRERCALARLLGELLADELVDEVDPLPEWILPVPLHPKRLGSRGYNQALELARPLARRFQIPIDIHSCTRARPTEALSRLDRAQRRRGIRGAFALRPDFRARHVVLVDDVVTTGSTVAEMALLLRRAGVERIDVWALARTADHRGVKGVSGAVGL